MSEESIENISKLEEEENENTLNEILKLETERIELLNTIISNMNDIKNESEKKMKLIKKNNMKERKQYLLNVFEEESKYQSEIKSFCEQSLILKNQFNNEKKFSSSHKEFNLSKLTFSQDDENFIEIVKINNSKIAIRSDNLIKFEDISKKNIPISFKPSFGNNKIIYFCSYQHENLLVSLQTKTKKYFIELIDLEKNMNSKLADFDNKISYISISTDINKFYLIEQPNNIILFKNEKIENKKTIEEMEEINSIIEINQNILFCTNEYGYCVYDIGNNIIIKKNIPIEKKKKYNPQNISQCQNFIVLSGINRFYFIETEKFEIASKVKVLFEKCYFCDEAPFVCLINENIIYICEIIPDLKNLLFKKKKKYDEESIINSITFNGPDQILLLVNSQIIQSFYLN